MDTLVERLRSSEPLPVCPYDRRSPDYWTAPNDKPCPICGSVNEVGAPDLCRGADTRIMGEAAAEIARLRTALEKIITLDCWSNKPYTGEDTWSYGQLAKIAQVALGHEQSRSNDDRTERPTAQPAA